MKRKKETKKKKGTKRYFVLMLLAALLVGVFIGSLIFTKVELYKYKADTEEAESEEIEISEIPSLSTDGFVVCDISVEPSIIHLIAKCLQLDMITNEVQTSSIEKGLQKELSVRPWGHDLVAQILENFGIKVLLIKIHTLKEETGTYYATIFLQKGNRILALDSKPSDAIAIATRADAEIYIKEELLDKYGKKIC